jgi:hypothetical protein
MLLAFRDISSDERRLALEAARFLEMDEAMNDAAREYIRSRVWQVDGGLETDAATYRGLLRQGRCASGPS